RRYREFREAERAENERIAAEKLDVLYSCWTCGCAEERLGIRCADHGGPCRPGERQSLQGGTNEKNPAGATLIAMKEIRRCFPDQADEIIQSLRWQGWGKFWSFERWGHFVGVELDGHIHSLPPAFPAVGTPRGRLAGAWTVQGENRGI